MSRSKLNLEDKDISYLPAQYYNTVSQAESAGNMQLSQCMSNVNPATSVEVSTSSPRSLRHGIHHATCLGKQAISVPLCLPE